MIAAKEEVLVARESRQMSLRANLAELNVKGRTGYCAAIWGRRGMGVTGLKPGAPIGLPANDLRAAVESSAAAGAAIGSDFDHDDADLRAVIAAWPMLPATARAAILDVIRANAGGDGR